MDIVIQIIAIIVNVFIAFIAIFGERIKNFFFKPNLELSITNLFPDCNLTTNENGRRLFFFRMKIKNIGKVDASNVQVYLNEIKRKDNTGVFIPCNNVLPMNLAWAYHDKDPKEADIANLISPDMQKYCDFLYIFENSNECFLATKTQVFAYGLPSHLLSKGVYKASIILFASNTKPKNYTINFEYSGYWSSDPNKIITSLSIDK